MLKCPVCGKKYSYESKICKTCEDYLKYSSLINSIEESGYKEDYTHKWNCAVFLDDNRFIFTIKKRSKVKLELTNEPLNLRITPARNYDWNTESATRFKACIKKSLIESKIPVDPELIDDIMEVIVRKIDSPLIYE